MADVTIEARNTIKAFGQGAQAVRALDDVSIQINRGEFFTLLGSSGCGKTTLLRIVAGFMQQSSGRILFGDKPIDNVPAHKRNTAPSLSSPTCC